MIQAVLETGLVRVNLLITHTFLKIRIDDFHAVMKFHDGMKIMRHPQEC